MREGRPELLCDVGEALRRVAEAVAEDHQRTLGRLVGRADRDGAVSGPLGHRTRRHGKSGGGGVGGGRKGPAGATYRSECGSGSRCGSGCGYGDASGTDGGRETAESETWQEGGPGGCAAGVCFRGEGAQVGRGSKDFHGLRAGGVGIRGEACIGFRPSNTYMDVCTLVVIKLSKEYSVCIQCIL